MWRQALLLHVCSTAADMAGAGALNDAGKAGVSTVACAAMACACQAAGAEEHQRAASAAAFLAVRDVCAGAQFSHTRLCGRRVRGMTASHTGQSMTAEAEHGLVWLTCHN
jgi:hypothetical protein